MSDVEFVCTECCRPLGKMRADAPDGEREEFRRSLEAQGFTPVHHFGWFCCRGCGEAFFGRQAEAFRGQSAEAGRPATTDVTHRRVNLPRNGTGLRYPCGDLYGDLWTGRLPLLPRPDEKPGGNR